MRILIKKAVHNFNIWPGMAFDFELERALI